jgi:signal transduction histidine kinase
MSFRGRLLLALGVVALGPLVVVAVGVRRETTTRLTAQYQRRVAALAAVTREDLARERTRIGERLASLGAALPGDNRFRRGAVLHAPGERAYVLDYAQQAMRMTGLSMLQIQDETGRIVSSGHFRNEFDRLEPDLPVLLSRAPGGAALVWARTPEGPMLVLARVDSVRLGGAPFTIVGGVAMERELLRRLARDDGLAVTLVLPDTVLSSDPELVADEALGGTGPPGGAPGARRGVVTELVEPYVAAGAAGPRVLRPARLVVTMSTGELAALRRGIDRWLAVAIAVTAAAVLLVALWLALRISRPVRALAATAARLDLDRLDLDVPVTRDDEIGLLEQRFAAMIRRLRASAATLREAERRATIGDLARQVNHDIKNGLAPIRNVLRHLGQVAQERPEELAAVFAERRRTLDAALAYLDALARNYARLTPRLALRSCDPNAVAREVAGAAIVPEGAELQLALDPAVPAVAADPVVLRRILENLVANAVESLAAGRGRVTLATEHTGDGRVHVRMADTGRGMTREQLDHAFDDFYTTKPNGTGLGLSIVRRLVTDLHGVLRVDTGPGEGTTVTIALPADGPPLAPAPAPPDTAPASPPHRPSRL